MALKPTSLLSNTTLLVADSAIHGKYEHLCNYSIEFSEQLGNKNEYIYIKYGF